jgi:hypothetical protein
VVLDRARYQCATHNHRYRFVASIQAIQPQIYTCTQINIPCSLRSSFFRGSKGCGNRLEVLSLVQVYILYKYTSSDIFVCMVLCDDEKRKACVVRAKFFTLCAASHRESSATTRCRVCLLTTVNTSSLERLCVSQRSSI